MTNSIRPGVIGAGGWAAEAHIPGILAHPDARLTLERAELNAAIVVTPYTIHYELERGLALI